MGGMRSRHGLVVYLSEWPSPSACRNSQINIMLPNGLEWMVNHPWLFKNSKFGSIRGWIRDRGEKTNERGCRADLSYVGGIVLLLAQERLPR
jgi:hypothetical protein